MANIELDGVNKKIKVDSGDLTLDVPGDIVLDADGGDVVVADGGTNILKVTNSSSDVVLQPQVDAKDIIFKQYDGTTVATVEDNGTFNIPASKLAIGGTAVTSTAAELNLLDGGTSVGSSITVADGDGIIMNDGGTMKSVPASALKTYAGGAGLNHIVTTSVSSAVGNVTFLNGSGGVTLDGTYNTYLITGTGIGLATDDTTFNMKISIDAGSNYNAQIYTSLHTVETTFGNNSASTGSQGQTSSGDVAIFAGAQGAYAGENINFNLLIFDVGSTSNKKSFTYQAVEHQYNNIVKVRNGGGIINTASDAIDGIRFAAGSGNISEGEFSLYGLAKS
jgi:hypothetical protein